MNRTADLKFSILDHSPIGHFILDEQLDICFWNRCLEIWTGRSREEMVGRSILDSFPYLGESKYKNRIAPIFHGGPPITFSAQLHKHFLPAPLPGGKKRIQQTVVTAMEAETPGDFLALFSIQDVTSLTEAVNRYTDALQQLTIEAEERKQEVLRRKEAEESLREMNRMKNDFISSAAHELNTPLTTILGYADLIQASGDAFSAEQKSDFVIAIIENTENLARITDDLLDIARFEVGREIPLEKSFGSPEALITKIVRRFEDQKEPRRFQLELAAGATCRLAFDPLRIRQVLENIISNAIKYSPENSIITIATRWHETGVVISVSDQGIGMSEKALDKVFDKFYRADASSTAISGLGLGMSIVRQIVEAHGGTVRVESVVQQGTTVLCNLPCDLPD
jgi:PAS domain S-box-containing protein